MEEVCALGVFGVGFIGGIGGSLEGSCGSLNCLPVDETDFCFRKVLS